MSWLCDFCFFSGLSWLKWLEIQMLGNPPRRIPVRRRGPGAIRPPAPTVSTPPNSKIDDRQHLELLLFAPLTLCCHWNVLQTLRNCRLVASAAAVNNKKKKWFCLARDRDDPFDQPSDDSNLPALERRLELFFCFVGGGEYVCLWHANCLFETPRRNKQMDTLADEVKWRSHLLIAWSIESHTLWRPFRCVVHHSTIN